MFQCLQSSSITLRNVNLSHNQLHVIFLVRTGCSILIDNCTITENILRRSILSLNYYSTSQVVISNIQGNKLFPSSQGSGILDVGQNSSLVLNGSNLTNNKAVNASVILVQGNSTFVAEHCTFIHNAAICGGVLQCKESSSVHVTVSSFTKNEAVRSGGVFYSVMCNIWIRNSNMTSNKARNDGGCIVSIDGSLLVSRK